MNNRAGMIALDSYPPVRQGSHHHSVVRDVESHLSASAYNYYREDTATTTVHECTHGINADLRNKFHPGGRHNCFYLLRNEWFGCPEPNWLKREVIPFIPVEYRSGDLFERVSGTAWHDRPLYLWDEWVAYVNGSELGETYSINHALVFGFYAGAVLKREQNFALHDLFDLLCFRLESHLQGSDQQETYEKLRKWSL